MATSSSPRSRSASKTAKPNQSIVETNNDANAEAPPETNKNATVATENLTDGKRTSMEGPDTTENFNTVKESNKRNFSMIHHQQQMPSADEQAKKSKPTQYLSRKEANDLLIASGEAISSALKDLAKARALANRAGLSVDSRIVVQEGIHVNDEKDTISSNTANAGKKLIPRLKVVHSNFTTGGHSNTDHVVLRTGNERVDRIAELKRNLVRRSRAMQPESRGDSRWDKPRKFGERRRRIVREKDLPNAPPEPPGSGYILFVAQMTTKIRHDRPNVPHDQSKVMQEISKIWRLGMREEDRKYYNEFVVEARKEYEKQQIEFRATGSFTPSADFHKLDGVNVWVRSKWHEKNGLEQELAQYDSFQFPRRPPELDRRYEDQLQVSKFRRKLKLKGLLNEDLSVKESAKETNLELVKKYESARARLEGHPEWKGPSRDTTDMNVTTKLVSLMRKGMPVRYSFLRSQFSDSVSDESILKALKSCAFLIRGNFILQSNLMPISSEVALARTFILFLLQTEGFLFRGRLDRAFKDDDSTNSVNSDGIRKILGQACQRAENGWKLRVDDDTSFVEKHPDAAFGFLRFWGDQVHRFGSLLDRYRAEVEGDTKDASREDDEQESGSNSEPESSESGDESDESDYE